MQYVYHFILDHRVGGPHVYVDTLRNALPENVKSVVVTTGHGPMTELSLVNLRHYWTPLYALELLINMLILLLMLLTGSIKRQHSIFHVHGGVNLAPLLAARLAGIPVMWLIHETTPSYSQMIRIGKRILKGYRQHAIAVVANRAREVYGLDGAELLPATIDPAFWSRANLDAEIAELVGCKWRDEPDRFPRAFRLLAIANLNPLKGIDVLLDALAEVNGGWHLQVIGIELKTHKDYVRSLFQKADEVVQQNPRVCIDFLGWQDKYAIRELLASCDAFVLPSRSEACPIALLEAISMGCTCVAADVGDVRLMLNDYPAAIVFPMGSAIILHDELIKLKMRGDVEHVKGFEIGSMWRTVNVAESTQKIYEFLLK